MTTKFASIMGSYEWKKWQAFGNILHIHVHKCGGTSLRLALEVSNPESPKFRFRPGYREIEKLDASMITSFGTPASHAQPEQIINDIGIEEFMKRIRVSTCRNPFARIVSMYTYWLKRANNIIWDRKNPPIGSANPSMVERADAFRDFALHSGRHKTTAVYGLALFPPQKHYLMYKGEVVVDNILRLENIQYEWTAFINQHIINNETIEHRKWIPKEFPLFNRSCQDDYKEYYRDDKELIERVAEMYQEDIEYFGYEF